jgi:hypothetical protein
MAIIDGEAIFGEKRRKKGNKIIEKLNIHEEPPIPNPRIHEIIPTKIFILFLFDESHKKILSKKSENVK